MKITVVIPVYNAEKYLEKCITSVLKQTYKNLEIIIIDDGSNDNSSLIIKKMAKLDSRIIFIQQENLGPGIARNKGIEHATGKYVVFLDSDDFLESNYLELISIKAQNKDLIFIDVLQVTKDLKEIKKEKMSIYKNWPKEKIIRAQMTGKIPWGGVRKVVRLDLLKKNNIRYTSHKIGEEALYSFRVLHAATSIEFICEKPVYYYVNHENSQSKLKVIDPWGEVVKCLKEYLLKNFLYEQFAETINAFNITALIISLDRIEQLYSGEKKRRLINKRVKCFKKLYDYNVKVDKKSMNIKARIFIPFIRRDIYFPISLCSKLKNKLKILNIK